MRKRILVVDDDPDIRQVLQDRLESYGYLVETAADGCAALKKLERRTPSGIFLDIRMPGMDGLKVLAQIRNRHPSVPVVIVTAASARECASSAISAGAQAYLLKPFDTSQIKHVAERWFGEPLERENHR
jgi:CheY-like chemotaxis protein